MTGNWTKTLATALAISTGYEVLYWLYHKYVKASTSQAEDSMVEVAFFPDSVVACEAFFSYGCSNKACWHAHEETSSMKIASFLQSAQQSLDVCVYCITSQELVDVLLKCRSRGVVIRVLTDRGQASQDGVQIGRLRSNGIEVRTNDSSFFMHHKFAVADQKMVLTGSFNWSRNAMLGNHENILMVKTQPIVTQYQKEFDRLWTSYNPH